ncbi:hypothetical protein ACJX0J_031957, partial [Zea mays]
WWRHRRSPAPRRPEVPLVRRRCGRGSHARAASTTRQCSSPAVTTQSALGSPAPSPKFLTTWWMNLRRRRRRRGMTSGGSGTGARVTPCSWTTGTARVVRARARRCCHIAGASSYWWTADWSRESHRQLNKLQHMLQRMQQLPSALTNKDNRDLRTCRGRNSWTGNQLYQRKYSGHLFWDTNFLFFTCIILVANGNHLAESFEFRNEYSPHNAAHKITFLINWGVAKQAFRLEIFLVKGREIMINIDTIGVLFDRMHYSEH